MIALALTAGCTLDSVPNRVAKNVVIIVIDTLRADRLRAYGSTKNLTPFIDSLADRGFVFNNTYATSPWTSPSVASIFTSRYQSQHRILSFRSTLDDDEITLAETLAKRGYRTGAFCANFLLNPRYGYRQGFEHYKVFIPPPVYDRAGTKSQGKARAEQVNAQALQWLDELETSADDSGVFLYLHYVEPHNPYHPDEKFLDHLDADRKRPDRNQVNSQMLVAQYGGFPEEMVRAVEDYYNAEVRSLDLQLRKLFGALQTRGFLQDAVVFITADHGEEFHEHGRMGHGQTLFEETIRIPLIILTPDQRSRAEIDQLTSLVDIAPTALDLAGFPVPETFRGRSLRDAMGLSPRPWFSAARPAEDEITALSESIRLGSKPGKPHERAFITDSGKLIVNADATQEFYDLDTDPAEKEKDGLDETARALLSDKLDTLLFELSRTRGSDVLNELDPETAERMRALGYSE